MPAAITAGVSGFTLFEGSHETVTARTR